MKRKIIIVLSVLALFCCNKTHADIFGDALLKVQEVDESPSVYPEILIFPNSSLTDNGDTSVSIDFVAPLTGTFLKLDQTTPQTVINGAPVFNAGAQFNADIDVGGNKIYFNNGGSTTYLYSPANGKYSFVSLGADMLTIDNNNTLFTEASTFNFSPYSGLKFFISDWSDYLLFTRISNTEFNFDLPTDGTLSITGNLTTTAGDADEIPALIQGKSTTYTATAVQPDTISGLLCWLKADAITGLNDGDAITTWTASGGGRNATAAGAVRPLYKTNILNSLPVVRFDGADDVMAIGGSAMAPRTIFIVFNYTEGATFVGTPGLFTETTYTASWGPIGTNGGTALFGGPPAIYFDWQRVNGVLDTDGSVSLGTLVDFKVYTGLQMWGSSYYGATWQLGRDRQQGASFWGGDVAEVIIYSGILTAQEVVNVEKYLSDKYNITITNPAWSHFTDYWKVKDGSGNVVAKVDLLGNATFANQTFPVYMGTIPEYTAQSGGIWFGTSAQTPMITNAAFFGSSYQTAFNAPNAGISDMEFRVGNANCMNVGKGTATTGGMQVGGGGYMQNVAPTNMLKVGFGTAQHGTADLLATMILQPWSAAKKGIVIQGYPSQSANIFEYQDSGGNVLTAIDASGNLVVTTDSGIKIGTATTQKLGFWDATPVDQPAAITAGLTGVTHTAPSSEDYAIQDFVDVAGDGSQGYSFKDKDEANTILKVIANLQTRIDELEARLEETGIITAN